MFSAGTKQNKKRDTRLVLGGYCAFCWCNLIYFPAQGCENRAGEPGASREEGAVLLLQPKCAENEFIIIISNTPFKSASILC